MLQLEPQAVGGDRRQLQAFRDGDARGVPQGEGPVEVLVSLLP
ncbi:hypothetical protein ACU686_26420 [Yinghuangia aomiensis]